MPITFTQHALKRMVERAGKHQLLRVLFEGDTVVAVVTVMATSKFEKYGIQV